MLKLASNLANFMGAAPPIDQSPLLIRPVNEQLEPVNEQIWPGNNHLGPANDWFVQSNIQLYLILTKLITFLDQLASSLSEPDSKHPGSSND